MKKVINLIIPIIFVINSFAQNWTEPVNVSNMGGFNQVPDFCFDNNGVIHCVWVHVFETNFSKIFYNRSYDDGLTWTTPEDISLNDEKRIGNPHIVCDSENNLHLTYDFDTGNYFETLIYYKKFDGTWSEPFIVSENILSSYKNILIIDNLNRLYCFWYHTGINGYFYYRYYEEEQWSEIFCPYTGNNHIVMIKPKVDINNNLKCIGSFHGDSQSNEDIIVFFEYFYENNIWGDLLQLTNNTTGPGKDLDLDNSNKPHIAWRQKTPMTGPGNDSTMYRYFNGISWSYPELVVEDPKEQKIIIDNNNQPNIFDREKYENGYKLLYYYKFDEIWQGYIIDEADNLTSDLNPIKTADKIFIVYSKSDIPAEGDIMLSKMDMIANIIEIKIIFGSLRIFPNPFSKITKISFSLNKIKNIQIKIYSIQGKLINTLINENKTPGQYEIIWNGKNLNGKEVKPGLYLIRLQSGRNILTRSVEYIK